MSSLKQDMRRMFDERSGARPGFDSTRLEDGLVQKIINLALRNLYVFEKDPINIIAVNSPKAKLKLYTLSKNEQMLLDASTVLICLRSKTPGIIEHSFDSLISMSLLYASKYYAVDYYSNIQLDLRQVEKEMHVDADKEIAAVVCLGYFGSGYFAANKAAPFHSCVIKEL